MSETKETGDKTIHGSRKTITLKTLKRTVDAGHVRQNFSHGRHKNVLVEKKKKRRILAPDVDAGAAGVATTGVATTKGDSTTPAPVPAPAKPGGPGGKGRGTGKAGGSTRTAGEKSARGFQRGLSDEEKQARLRALTLARAREAEEKVQAERRAKEEEEKRRREAEATAKLEAEAAKAKADAGEVDAGEVTGAPASPLEREKPETSPRTESRPIPEKAARDGKDGARKARAGATAAADVGKARDAAPRKPDVKAKKPKTDRTPNRRTSQPRRFKGRLTINNALDEGQRERSLASLQRRREREKARLAGTQQPRDKIAHEVVIPETITIQELANRMAERAVDVMRYLMKQGQMHKINDVIDADTAELIVEEFGHTAKRVSESDVEVGFIGEEDTAEDLEPRAPVVTVMGHVDHGKTSLLDAIRNTEVAASEAGGITQHIGAYQVETPSGGEITFIDTPGHAAFTAMRARGARVTDIVILVVAADDGVMPQTIEAINHARDAGVPIIVAINKIDKTDADPGRVRTDLLQHEIVVESMGGDVLEIEVSALKRQGLGNLLEAVAMQAEILEFTANPNRSAEGVVIEAKLERGRGPVGTVLVQRGALRLGQIIVAGTAWGKVRALIDDHGRHIEEAGSSVPAEVLGFDSTPAAGDQFAVVESEARAREITEYRKRKCREITAAGAGSARTLEQMMSQLKEGSTQEFPLLVKADAQGSAEAIIGALEKLGTDEVAARIVHSGVGGITESDISLAAASGAVVMGFNVRANAQALAAAERSGVEIRYYAVIYNLVDDVKSAMSGLLAPMIREHLLGNAEILEIFNVSKVGKVAGCRVTDGKVERGAHVRLIRDNVVIHEGRLSTLKRFKDEAKEVVAGQECGMAFEAYQDMRAGDVIECFRVEEVERTL